MRVVIDGKGYEVNLAQLAGDLLLENKELVTFSRHGELVFDDMTFGRHYAYRREVWQMRPEGSGINNTEWAGQQFEFCRSIKLTHF